MTHGRDDFEIEVDGQLLRYPLDWPGLREPMCRWLDANGLDHREVCVPQRAVIADGKLTVWLYELNADGDRFVRHPDDTKAAKVTATVSLTEEPPDPPRLSAPELYAVLVPTSASGHVDFCSDATAAVKLAAELVAKEHPGYRAYRLVPLSAA